MRILLLIPTNRSYVVMPSLGLGYVASVIRQQGHDVEILHCIKERMTHEAFADFMKSRVFDLVGIQMFTFDMSSVKKHLKIIKEASPTTITVLGGYHPSGDREGVLLTQPDADFAFASEVEIAFPVFLTEIQKKLPVFENVPNLIWRKGDGIAVNDVSVVHDLDTIPFPAWDLMDPRTFPEAPHGGFVGSFPTAPIIITRGCPMQCTFCAGKSVTTDRVRTRSADNVIAEIKFLQTNYGVNDFLIEDENFTAHRGLVREVCQRIIDERLNITWSCPSGVRLDTLNLEILKLMEQSGCYSLAVGVEFGSERILNLTKKHLTIATIRQKLELFRQVNIKTTGFFMFGVPGETRSEMIQTIKLAKSLGLDRAQFNNFMPLPGSEIYDDLKKQGMKEIDYDHFFVHDVGYVPDGMSRHGMKMMQRRAYLEFYLRPTVLFRLLSEITRVKQLFYLFKRLVDALT